jgi:hypothetical protein
MFRDLTHALDAVTFAREALSFDPDPWQQQVLRSSAKRILLNCCRQSGKSTITSIMALHRALFYPASTILVISASQRQSSELFKKIVGFVDHLAQRPRLREDNRLSMEMQDGSRIVSLPSSEATIRGFSGVDLLILDEASRITDDVYHAVKPMIAVSNGRIIALSTPFGKRGFFYREWTEGGDGWERVRIPASECPRITPEFLESERRSMPAFVYQSEYEGVFTDTIDQVFATEWIEAALTDEITPLFPVVP